MTDGKNPLPMETKKQNFCHILQAKSCQNSQFIVEYLESDLVRDENFACDNKNYNNVITSILMIKNGMKLEIMKNDAT